jgi:predicted ATP-grasp superfamily ATP-dependent carboligase
LTTPGAVVIGGYANGVSALRSLARAGVRTAVVLTKPYDIAHHSRYAHEAHRVLDLHRRPDGLIDLLQDRAGEWRGWALIPTNDYALTALAEHRELLSRWYPLSVPEPEIVQRVVVKPNTYRLAAEAGVAVPRCYGPASRVTAQRTDICYPVVVKPQVSAAFWERLGKKLIVARSPLELVAAIDHIERAGLAADVFDLVPGPDDEFYNYTVYLDRQGQPVAEFGFRKLRKAPPFFGVARAAEPATVPELREPTIELLRRIGWRGVASAEYKRDPRDGRFKLMEINGRCYLSHALATRCGVNYPLLIWQEHARRQRVSASSNGWRGTWLHLHADLLYTAVQERGSDWNWRKFIRSYTGPWIDAVWSPADPVPFLAQWRGTLHKAAQEIRSGREMEEVRQRFQPMPVSIPTPFGRDMP